MEGSDRTLSGQLSPSPRRLYGRSWRRQSSPRPEASPSEVPLVHVVRGSSDSTRVLEGETEGSSSIQAALTHEPSTADQQPTDNPNLSDRPARLLEQTIERIEPIPSEAGFSSMTAAPMLIPQESGAHSHALHGSTTKASEISPSCADQAAPLQRAADFPEPFVTGMSGAESVLKASDGESPFDVVPRGAAAAYHADIERQREAMRTKSPLPPIDFGRSEESVIAVAPSALTPVLRDDEPVQGADNTVTSRATESQPLRVTPQSPIYEPFEQLVRTYPASEASAEPRRSLSRVRSHVTLDTHVQEREAFGTHLSITSEAPSRDGGDGNEPRVDDSAGQLEQVPSASDLSRLQHAGSSRQELSTSNLKGAESSNPDILKSQSKADPIASSSRPQVEEDKAIAGTVPADLKKTTLSVATRQRSPEKRTKTIIQGQSSATVGEAEQEISRAPFSQMFRDLDHEFYAALLRRHADTISLRQFVQPEAGFAGSEVRPPFEENMQGDLSCGDQTFPGSTEPAPGQRGVESTMLSRVRFENEGPQADLGRMSERRSTATLQAAISSGETTDTPVISPTDDVPSTQQMSREMVFRYMPEGQQTARLPEVITCCRHPKCASLCCCAACAGATVLLQELPDTASKSFIAGAVAGFSSGPLLQRKIELKYPLIGAAISCGYLGTMSFLKGCCAVLDVGTGSKYISLLKDPSQPYMEARKRLAQRLGEQWVLTFEQWARNPQAAPFADMMVVAELRDEVEPLNWLGEDLSAADLADPEIVELFANEQNRALQVMNLLKVNSIGRLNYPGIVLASHLTKRGGVNDAQHNAMIEDAKKIETLCKEHPLPQNVMPRDIASGVIHEKASNIAAFLPCIR